jgi:hypothetical protein
VFLKQKDLMMGKNMVYRDASPERKVGILDFVIGEKRILTITLNDCAKEYFEKNYPEYYRDYLAGIKGKIYLTALIIYFDKERQKLIISLYEEQESPNGVGTKLVKFEHAGYFNSQMRLKIPFESVHNLVICQTQESQK